MADKEYIDREAVLKKMQNWNTKERLINCVEYAPAVDAVEVVRCKECKNYNTEGCSDGWGWCEASNSGTHDNRYCSDGERRE